MTDRITGGHTENKISLPGNYIANEITDLAENLEQIRLRINDFNDSKNRFVIGLSHDLRTPVAIIQGYTEGILDGLITGPEKIRKSMKIILSNTNNLNEMITEMIDFVKIDMAERTENITKENLTALVKEYTECFSGTAEIYRKKFIYDIQLDDDLLVDMDKHLTGRMLVNLLTNSFKYTGDNGLIEFSAWQEKNSAFIQIKDNGPGISKEDKDHIFEFLFRASNSRNEAGHGIGLSIVNTVINMHNWKIDVDSNTNPGESFTCFKITIPLGN